MEEEIKKKFNKNELFTIPNILSYLRILLIPVFCYLYLTSKEDLDYLYATIVVLISSLTDLFDGMIARKFNQVTELGKVLDPVADKLTHAALAVCLAIRYPYMWILIGLMIIKEGYMGIMGLISIKKNCMMNGAMWYGKICTGSLFIGLLILFLFPHMELIGVNILIGILTFIMLVTLILYIIFYHKLFKNNKEKNELKDNKNL